MGKRPDALRLRRIGGHSHRTEQNRTKKNQTEQASPRPGDLGVHPHRTEMRNPDNPFIMKILIQTKSDTKRYRMIQNDTTKRSGLNETKIYTSAFTTQRLINQSAYQNPIFARL